MKKRTKVIGGAAVLAALVLCPAPDADATPATDTAGFLSHIHAIGFPASGDTMSLNSGMRACTAITAYGSTEAALQAKAEQVLGEKGYTAAQADQFVLYAIVDLCPEVAQ